MTICSKRWVKHPQFPICCKKMLQFKHVSRVKFKRLGIFTNSKFDKFHVENLPFIKHLTNSTSALTMIFILLLQGAEWKMKLTIFSAWSHFDWVREPEWKSNTVLGREARERVLLPHSNKYKIILAFLRYRFQFRPRWLVQIILNTYRVVFVWF